MHSAHSVYRDQLMLLADDASIVEVISWPADRPGRDANGGEWQRVYGRFFPWQAPYAQLVFEHASPTQRLVTVELFETKPEIPQSARVSRHEGLGWIATADFPSDRRLPTLRQSVQSAPNPAVVRYRPGRRCTFRVQQDGAIYFCKVFPDDEGARLHEEAGALWQAQSRGELGFAVAEPVRWDAGTRTLWQKAVEGSSVLPRLGGPQGRSVARRLGNAAGTLVTSSVRPRMRFDAVVQCARSSGYARELGTRVPALAASAAALGRDLELMHRETPGRSRPIHGSPHLNQWLESSGRLGLVDFDRLSLGDPELDVATFLGELDFEDGLAVSHDELAANFIEGYEAAAGRIDSGLLAAYRAHKRLAKALRSARALRPDGDARAARHLARALDALGHERRAS